MSPTPHDQDRFKPCFQGLVTTIKSQIRSVPFVCLYDTHPLSENSPSCFDNAHRWEEVNRSALGKQGISIHDMTACVRIRSEENCVGLKIFLPCFSGAPCIWSAAVAVKFLLLLCSCRSAPQEECYKKCGRKLLKESGYAGFTWRRMLVSVCNKTDV